MSPRFSIYSIVIVTLCVLFTGCQSMVRFAARPDAGSRGSGYAGSYGEAEPSSKVERSIVSAAERWIGTPYRYAGTNHSGIDCSALMVNVFAEIGVGLPRTSTEQFETGRRINPGDLDIGDLVFFDINGSGVSHVGIYVGGNAFIHASLSAGVVRESLTLPYYAGRFAGARRVLGQ